MPFQITIKPSSHAFAANQGETVLEAALHAGFTLPYGCRDGACGACKGKLVEGTVDYGDHQITALTEQEKQAGMALFCCARPQSDLVIESREIGGIRDIEIKTLPCRVQQLQRLTPDVMVMHLKLPANERLQFVAGQYVDILLKNGSRRSFSMANPPHNDDLLELHLRNYGGAFTQHVFGDMKEKEILRFVGPFGTFFLREDSDKPIIFLASGTGFAPVKGILEHAFHIGVKRQMVLYWGARIRADLYMMDLPEKWRREHDNFRFVPVLSEAPPSDNWSGRAGFVHLAVMEDFADLSRRQVYACGAPVMVEAAHRDFTSQQGLPEEEFFSDAFTVSTNSKPAV